MEGCGYRDLYDSFNELGVSIVGVGFDSPEANSAWLEAENFLFELWTDDDKALALYYGAAESTDATYPSRLTRILNSEGEMILEYNAVNVATSPAEVLSDCIILFGDE